jgi:hypothetical protein
VAAGARALQRTPQIQHLRADWPIRRFRTNRYSRYSQAFTPDGGSRAVGGRNFSVIVLQDVASGTKVRVWTFPGSPARLLVAPDGWHLITLNGDAITRPAPAG